MAADSSGAPGRRFVVLPWVLGGAGLLLYLISLNHWVSFSSLGLVARVLDWNGPPVLVQPLTSGILYFSRALPTAWLPALLNLFSAVCAAAVLTLLARSVELLPHRCGPEDPFRKSQDAAPLGLPTAWMPPVLAVLVCGLELSFWEHATSFTGEMVDLVVVAYVIRCLLEFRTSREQFWLSRCAFVYAAGMANNWALVGCFPVLLLALVWLKGLSPFLEIRFLLRMSLWGLAGLSLYVLWAIVQSLSIREHLGFWPVLKAHLKFQKNELDILYNPTFRMLAIASLLPILMLSIPWKSHTVQFGDDSRLGVFLTKATGHFVHGLAFGVCLWLMLDPSFSPRNLGFGFPMLTFYYVAALVAGYCAGYMLLFGTGGRGKETGNANSAASREGNPASLRRLLQGIPAKALLVLIVWMTLALVWRNWGQMALTNGSFVREFGRGLYASLPGGDSVALSEEGWQRMLLQAELTAHNSNKGALLVDTLGLFSPTYQNSMAAKYKTRWPAVVSTNKSEVADTRELQDLVAAFAAKEPVVYLHPSSGLFLERFKAKAEGAVYTLAPRPTTPEEDITALGSEVVRQSEDYWERRWAENLQKFATQLRRAERTPVWASSLRKLLHLSSEPNATGATLAKAYSKALDYWGVQLQRSGRWAEAGIWFKRALELNPANLAAWINALYNQRCQSGEKGRLDSAEVQQHFAVLFEQYKDWRAVLNDHGPVDEPTFLFRTGRVLEAAGYPRQASVEFARGAELAPQWPVPKLWLTRCRLELGDFQGAVELSERMQKSSPPQTPAGRSELLYYKAIALRELGRTNEAAACVERFLAENPEEPAALSTAAELYAENKDWDAELTLLESWLKQDPNNVKLLGQKGFVELRLGRNQAAMGTFTDALALAGTDAEARFGRATAAFRSGHLDAAREDYQELLKTAGHSPSALLGLGNVAWRQQDTNAAIGFYQQYLSNAVPRWPGYALATERLKQLNGE